MGARSGALSVRCSECLLAEMRQATESLARGAASVALAAACEAAKFFCRNEGFRGDTVSSMVVNDGVCDW